MVVTRGGREATQGNLGRYLTGLKEEEATERDIHTLVAMLMQRSRSGSRGAGMQTEDAWVGGFPRAVGGDFGMGTGDTQVGR